MSTYSIQIGEITRLWAVDQGIKTKYEVRTQSTNSWAKSESFLEDVKDDEVVLYLTDEQTQGRGRFDRTWIQTPRGSALLSSWSFLISQFPQSSVSLRAGNALFNAAQSTWPYLPWALKAPNDLYLNENKIAGVLTECVSQGSEHRLIIGIGLNVWSYPKELPNATCLTKALTKETPLVGEDWIHFLERLFFELSLVIPQAGESLSISNSYAIMSALNRFQLLEKKYQTPQDLKLALDLLDQNNNSIAEKPRS